MNRDQATKWLEQVKPLLSHETREAVSVLMEDSRLVQEWETRPVYYCDALRIRDCNKRECFLNGGDCRLTTVPERALMYCGKRLKAPGILEVEE